MSNEEYRFANLERGERELLFEALLFCIDSNSGIGFQAGDQGNACYAAGAETGDTTHYRDSPDRNAIFLMLREFSLEVAEGKAGALRTHLVTDWQQFCRRVYGASKRPNTYTRLIEQTGQES